VAVSTTTANTVFTRGTTDVTSTTQWSNFSASYAEARVLAITIKQAGFTGGTGFAVFGTDRSGTASVANQAAVWGLQAARAYNTDSTAVQPHSYTARAIDLEDQLFSPVAAMPNNYAIFGINAAAAPILIEYLVEFKGSL